MTAVYSFLLLNGVAFCAYFTIYLSILLMMEIFFFAVWLIIWIELLWNSCMCAHTRTTSICIHRHSDFTDATKVFLNCYPQQHAYPQSARVLGVLVLTSNPHMSYHSWMFPFIKYLTRLCLVKSFIFNFKKYCYLFLIFIAQMLISQDMIIILNKAYHMTCDVDTFKTAS